MSRPKSTHSKEADTYHHGNLRQTLLREARASLKEKGVDKLSLREVARNAGVSHAAAYHHFKDKTALVAAVAVAAFGELEAVMQAVPRDDDTPERLEALMRGYVTFALDYPDEFRLMFSPQLRSDEVRTEVESAGRATYALIVGTLASLKAEGRLKPADPERAAITAWSAAHGLAALMLDGPLYRNAQTGADREALISSSVEHLLLGLLLT